MTSDVTERAEPPAGGMGSSLVTSAGMVIPRAMGAADDVLAWVLRGWVEAGVPDLTLGGTIPESGALSAENVRYNGGVEGVLLTFPGFDPGEEWVYAVVAAGASVHVACGDTLFVHAYAGLKPEEYGGRILADVRAHNEAFTRWRAEGGVVGLSESRSIRIPRGEGVSRALSDLVERRYAIGQTLEPGPAEGWWLEAHTSRAFGGAIRVGDGADPTFRLGAVAPTADNPEQRAYAASIRTLGGVLMGVSIAGALVGGLVLTWAGFNVFKQRADVILTRGIDGVGDLLTVNAWPLLSFLGAVVFAGALFTAGLRMRSLRNLTLVRVLIAVAAVPCSGGCCVVGLPLGAWALYRLSNKHAAAVFGERRS